MNKRHFLIYYDNRTKEITKTTPHTWAKANQRHFPDYDFTSSKTNPTVDFIEKYLSENYGFEKKEYEEELIAVVYNFSPDIPTMNGLNFIL